MSDFETALVYVCEGECEWLLDYVGMKVSDKETVSVWDLIDFNVSGYPSVRWFPSVPSAVLADSVSSLTKTARSL